MNALSTLPQLPIGLNELPRVIDFAQMRADLQARLSAGTLAKPIFETFHDFAPGYYIRTWRAPAGQLAMTMRHKTRHAFNVREGAAVVWYKDGPRKLYRAPHWGITQPGTERVLLVLEDIIWSTFHATTETDIAAIQAELTECPGGLPA
jgi:hypothetical protein